MKWLVACFEPFGGAATNASGLVCAGLRSRDWAGRVVFAEPLPVTFADAWPSLKRALRRHPEVNGVLTLGQAAGRRQLDLECLALNFVDTNVPDAAGAVPPRGFLGDGPELRWGEIPWAELPADIPAHRSYSAGTYVCNALFFASLGWAAECPGRRAGFLHVPALDTQPEFVDLPRVGEQNTIANVARIVDFLVGT